MFLRKGILKICSKFTGEHPYRSVFKIALWHVYSHVNFLHIFRTPFYKNISGGLLLNFAKSNEWFWHQLTSNFTTCKNHQRIWNDRRSHRRFSIKKVSLKILQNLQENTCARFWRWSLRLESKESKALLIRPLRVTESKELLVF